MIRVVESLFDDIFVILYDIAAPVNIYMFIFIDCLNILQNFQQIETRFDR